MLHLPLALVTMTKLANQLVYRASRMNPTDKSLSASSFAANLFSSPSLRFFWAIERASL